jgi:hypothetical protein
MTSDRKDLSLSVNGMYPLLDLITEQGSSGLGNPFSYINCAHAQTVQVDKIVISQQSLQEFINVLSPSAYSSITKVNFKILDDFVLKPLGIYGSKEEIVRFLREINAVGDITYVLRFSVNRANATGTVRRNCLYERTEIQSEVLNQF